MGIGWIILILLLMFFVYLLLFPVIIKLDTKNNLYYTGLPGIAGIRLVKKEEKWKFYYHIFFIKQPIDFLRNLKEHSEKTLPKNRTKQRNKRLSVMFFPKMPLKIISVIKIKKIELKIDTGDYPLNAQLIPVAASLSDKRISLAVNFNNINELNIKATTRIISIIYFFIKLYMLNR